MQKSVLVNISDVCRAIGRPPAHLVTFLGQQLGTSSKIDKDGKAFVGGAFTEGNIQELIFVFLRQYVRCHRGQAGRCNSIETECISEGTKKNRQLFLVCKSRRVGRSFMFTSFAMPPFAHGEDGATLAP